MGADFLKRLASRLPSAWQQELKRIHFRRRILSDDFEISVPEYALLSTLVRPGDWVVDVGANVGHYTKRLSDLVGPSGRVIAFEPVPDTFALLAANVLHFRHRNVTLLNSAASNDTGVSGITMPTFDVGLPNYYRAALTNGGAGLQVVRCAIDGLALPGPVTLIKVDAEGHDAVVLRGAERLIRRDHPALLVEEAEGDVSAFLTARGYATEPIPGSPNTLFRWPGHA